MVEGPISKPKSRWGHVAFVAVVAISGAFASGIAGGCLPDLGAIPEFAGPSDDGAVTPASSLSCGDGIIDTLDDGGDAGESCDPGEASVAGCEDCRFVCSGAIGPAGHCYFFADPTESYFSAKNACEGANAHLVTYASADEAAFVEAFVASSAHPAAGAHWIGLINRDDLGGYTPPLGTLEPGWPQIGEPPCSGCFAVGVDDAGSFDLSTGADPEVNANCLVEQGGGWARANCMGGFVDAGSVDAGQHLRTTVCEREPIGQRIYPCGGVLCTTIPVTVGQKRYVLSPVPGSPDQARQDCVDKYEGGSLVVLESREEREQLVREIAARLPPPVEVWIGLSFVGDPDGGAWTWDDGTVLGGPDSGPSPWGEGEPMVNAGRAFLGIAAEQVDNQLAHSDGTPPDGGRFFVCQRPP